MFLTVPLSIMCFSLYTQQWYYVYVIQVLLTACEEDQFRPDPARKLSTNMYYIYVVPLLCVQ